MCECAVCSNFWLNWRELYRKCILSAYLCIQYWPLKGIGWQQYSMVLWIVVCHHRAQTHTHTTDRPYHLHTQPMKEKMHTIFFFRERERERREFTCCLHREFKEGRKSNSNNINNDNPKRDRRRWMRIHRYWIFWLKTKRKSVLKECRIQ